MPLQDSPSLEDVSKGKYKAPIDPDVARKRTRIFVGILVFVVLVLAGINFMQSDMAANLSRKGMVFGSAVDENDQPIQVEVFVYGTRIQELSDENGNFLLESVPVGEQSFIVAYGDIAAEVRATVSATAENDLGTVTVPTDLAIFIGDN